MSNLQDLTGLKNKVDALRAKAERARGVLENVEAELKETWKCESLEEAEVLLKKLQEKERKLAGRYTKSLAAFEEKWAEELKEC